MLVNTNKVRAENCDNVLPQYSNFLDRVPVVGSGVFSSFKSNVLRVDDFFFHSHDWAVECPDWISNIRCKVTLVL